MDYSKKQMYAETMDWEPSIISAMLQLPEERCVPSTQTTGNQGIRWSHTEGIVESVLADIVPLSGGTVFVAMSEEGKNTPRIYREVQNTLTNMGVIVNSVLSGRGEANDNR